MVMKSKRSKFPRPEPQDLTLESVAANDRSLPRPRGAARLNPRPENPIELITLNRTRDFGGLVPDQVGAQYWQCPDCQLISREREIVVECCRQIPNQVQICCYCVRDYNRLFRIGDGCMCQPRLASEHQIYVKAN